MVLSRIDGGRSMVKLGSVDRSPFLFYSRGD
jgi:hypothetical protein